MISDTVSDFADRGYEVNREICKQVAKSAVAHFDETGIHINGKLKWGYVASSEEYTFVVENEVFSGCCC